MDVPIVEEQGRDSIGALERWGGSDTCRGGRRIGGRHAQFQYPSVYVLLTLKRPFQGSASSE